MELQVDAAPSQNGGCESLADQIHNVQCPLPNLWDNLTFPETVHRSSRWLGNGGMSIRSRKWMVRMIRICPSDHSFGDTEKRMKNYTICTLRGTQEDMFFSLTTYLTGGNIASPIEAGFFGTDQVFGWPNTILKESNKSIFEHVQENNLNDAVLREYQDEMNTIGHALPIGQHKCYQPHINPGYGCVESKWCKYSFNEDNRPTDVLGDE
ncbi:hypothetical protein IV203_003970 [Nitzschia inconspicua]|uniref:DUF5672 domain-containing protein n=1 Tax=Nitzschia inconspicua TaxID=303405 RepID=A0A9K3PRH5_9STRA|nr:hypothetical protein IV203_003970 [Nitzschia inconspicua]